MIDINAYRDEGTISAGRGTPILVDNFNMKKSATYSIAYYPTHETTGAPMLRPSNPGEQDISYKVFTFFKLEGNGEVIKNMRIKVSMETAPEASNVQLFYKVTNTYETPTADYDGDMILLSPADGSILQAEFWPNLSTVGPNLATSRNTVYTLSSGTPLYTNYFVTQLRANKGSSVGNSAEVKLMFEVYEYGGV